MCTVYGLYVANINVKTMLDKQEFILIARACTIGGGTFYTCLLYHWQTYVFNLTNGRIEWVYSIDGRRPAQGVLMVLRLACYST